MAGSPYVIQPELDDTPGNLNARGVLSSPSWETYALGAGMTRRQAQGTLDCTLTSPARPVARPHWNEIFARAVGVL